MPANDDAAPAGVSEAVPPWWAFHGDQNDDPDIAAERRARLAAAPPWRVFSAAPDASLTPPPREEKGETYRCDRRVKDMVNAALVLRRPLLVTGEPGSGKSSLAYGVARELGLGRVLRWNITSRVTLKDGLYHYDALGRLQDSDLERGKVEEIGRFITLGPLGTALLPWSVPRVLLIDEIDKSDIDLPNDLLHVFEEGEYEIPELVRYPDPKDEGVSVWRDKADRPANASAAADTYTVTIRRGRVRCCAFPFVVLTSNAEREFPPAFLRRCLRLRLARPGSAELTAIVNAHFAQSLAASAPTPSAEETQLLIQRFLARRTRGTLANDQLLQALYLRLRGAADVDTEPDDEINNLINRLMHPLNLPEPPTEK